MTGDDDLSTPRVNFLAQNYPNPFNPLTTIRFGLKERAHVRLRIYDASGRLVRTLVDDVKTGGLHTVTWDARDMNGELVAGGTYFVTLEIEQKLHSRAKIIVLE